MNSELLPLEDVIVVILNKLQNGDVVQMVQGPYVMHVVYVQYPQHTNFNQQTMQK
jgi:hypothetical protein